MVSIQKHSEYYIEMLNPLTNTKDKSKTSDFISLREDILLISPLLVS